MIAAQIAPGAAKLPEERKQERRKETLNSIGTIALTLLIGFLIGGIVMLFAGFNPLLAYKEMASGVFGSPKSIITTVIKATPIIATGLSVAFANKCGLFNIGAEGQFLMGTIAASIVGYYVHLPSAIHPTVTLLCAALAAGALGALVGFLKAKFGISEVISGIMFNWIALYGRNALVTSLPGFEKSSNVSYPVQDTAQIKFMNNWRTSTEGQEYLKTHKGVNDFFKADVNWGIIIVLVLAVAVWFILNKTTLGYRVKAVGANRFAAEYAGINVNRSYMLSLFIAGALAGVAGGIQIIGVAPNTLSVLAAQEGYGFDGIAVALMGMSSPLGCVLSGLLFAALRYGGTRLQASMNVPSETINIMLGFIVLFAGIPGFTRIIRKWWNRRKNEKLIKNADRALLASETVAPAPSASMSSSTSIDPKELTQQDTQDEKGGDNDGK